MDKGVRKFSTFTRGLEEASKYLKLEGIEKIVMEATGIYWVPVYEHFEKEGFDVCLVNGAHAKNVPGRKTDVLDSEWLRELHTYGLLRASFIPEAQIRELRYYVRLRDDHIAMGATHINIKALKTALRHNPNITDKLIHHSDRGVQYCSFKYVEILNKYSIKISMTHGASPHQNSIAERVNGIIKEEWLYDLTLKNQKQAERKIKEIVSIYNTYRPHQTLNNKTPDQVHKEVF